MKTFSMLTRVCLNMYVYMCECLEIVAVIMKANVSSRNTHARKLLVAMAT